MYYFKVQWFAYPCFVTAIFMAVHAVYLVLTTWRGSDILPLVGFVTAVIELFLALAFSVLGWLVWRAFR
jgi:hypothetical protein